jgi:hypothetical protein
MAENERREKVMLLTGEYRILGEMRLGPDGTLWDFKHKSVDDFVSLFEAQCFRVSDGKRMYDATTMEVSRRAVIAVFKQQDLAFVRKESQ